MFHKGYKNQELNDFVLALNPTRLVMRLGILLLPALFSLAVSSNVNFQKPLTLPVDEKGTVFGYFDSGVPPHNPKTYNTIFAIHGLGFTSGRSAIHANTTKKLLSETHTYSVQRSTNVSWPSHPLMVSASSPSPVGAILVPPHSRIAKPPSRQTGPLMNKQAFLYNAVLNSICLYIISVRNLGSLLCRRIRPEVGLK